MTTYVEDTKNSTTITLTAGSTFTGESSPTDTTELAIMIYSDTDSEIDGHQVQYSSDGANWDVSIKNTYRGGVQYKGTFPIYGKYFRIIYTNGSINQTTFRLQALKKTSTDFYYSVSAGDFVEKFSLQKFGHIDGPSPSAWSDVNTWGNYTYDSSNTTMQVTSDSTAETNIPIVVQGINSSGNLVNETINTDGSDGRTPSVGSTPFYRVFRAYVDGNVISDSSTFYVAKGGTTPVSGVPSAADKRAELLDIHHQSSMALYTVPANHRMVVTDVQLSAQKSTSVHVEIIAQIRPMDGSKSWRTIYRTGLTNFSLHFIAKTPWVIPEKYDVRMRVKPGGSGSFTSVGWNAILEKYK